MAKEPKKPRYLIGHGEHYTHEEPYPGRGGGHKDPVYSTDDIKEKFLPRLSLTLEEVSKTPTKAKPQGRDVVMVTLHPEFLAKSSFPSKLFNKIHLQTIGSRSREIKPNKWSESKAKNPKPKPETAQTIDLYMSAQPRDLLHWYKLVTEMSSDSSFWEQMGYLEDVRPLADLNAHGRLQIDDVVKKTRAAEVAIHIPEDERNKVFPAFRKYASDLGIDIATDLCIDVPGLLFVPVRAEVDALEELSRFTFIRTIRAVTKLRDFPSHRATRSMGKVFPIPTTPPLNPALRATVIGGGLPSDYSLPFVTARDAPGVGKPASSFIAHGLAVTGAVMWGEHDGQAYRPYGSIDHFRVLDARDARGTDFYAYDILRRIEDVIETSPNDIFNLSLGPNAPADDGEVHPWTSKLDSLGADGSRLIVVAAGNNGTNPPPLCRIQAPSDGVNCLSVGAADRQDANWSRANGTNLRGCLDVSEIC